MTQWNNKARAVKMEDGSRQVLNDKDIKDALDTLQRNATTLIAQTQLVRDMVGATETELVAYKEAFATLQENLSEKDRIERERSQLPTEELNTIKNQEQIINLDDLPVEE